MPRTRNRKPQAERAARKDSVETSNSLLTPLFRLLASRTVITFWGCKPPSVWYLVTTAEGNESITFLKPHRWPFSGGVQSFWTCQELKSFQPEQCTKGGPLPGNIRHNSFLPMRLDLKSFPSWSLKLGKFIIFLWWCFKFYFIICKTQSMFYLYMHWMFYLSKSMKNFHILRTTWL